MKAEAEHAVDQMITQGHPDYQHIQIVDNNGRLTPEYNNAVMNMMERNYMETSGKLINKYASEETDASLVRLQEEKAEAADEGAVPAPVAEAIERPVYDFDEDTFSVLADINQRASGRDEYGSSGTKNFRGERLIVNLADQDSKALKDFDVILGHSKTAKDYKKAAEDFFFVEGEEAQGSWSALMDAEGQPASEFSTGEASAVGISDADLKAGALKGLKRKAYRNLETMADVVGHNLPDINTLTSSQLHDEYLKVEALRNDQVGTVDKLKAQYAELGLAKEDMEAMAESAELIAREISNINGTYHVVVPHGDTPNKLNVSGQPVLSYDMVMTRKQFKDVFRLLKQKGDIDTRVGKALNQLEDHIDDVFVKTGNVDKDGNPLYRFKVYDPIANVTSNRLINANKAATGQSGSYDQSEYDYLLEQFNRQK
jgi:hypothetical protein